MISTDKLKQFQDETQAYRMSEEKGYPDKIEPEALERAPRFSIISVVMNNQVGIKLTLESIIKQTISDYEIIVVDGKSTDETLKVVNDYQPFVNHLISEPDDGVYHAMMKGVRLAKGEWIIFMNSGDIFDSPYVLESFKPLDNVAMAYGDVKFRTKSKSREFLMSAKPLGNLWKGIVFSHQSLFCRREVLQELGFNLRYSIVADYDFYVRAYKRGFMFQDLNYCVASVEPGGLSENFYRRTIERFPIALKAFPDKPIISHFSTLVLKEIRTKLKFLSRRNLPK